MRLVLILFAFAAVSAAQGRSAFDRVGISILNSPNGHGATENMDFALIDAGPAVTGFFYAHLFPGIQDYAGGRYTSAEYQMSYVVDRPSYLDGNARQGEFLSLAHYIRGMIYLYHAQGVGQYRLAKTDFEQALKWNPRNYIAYVEMSRVYAKLGLKEPAISILRQLLEMKSIDDKVANEARQDLQKLVGNQGK